ncbi:MAG: hypothetical protein ABFD82_21305 [Syntrophaceae bacterium]
MQKRIIIIYALCILLLIASVGCAGSTAQHYGRIVPDGNATQVFEKYQIDPNYNYYISGSDVYPNAFIGLDKSYILESTLWKKVEMTPKKFRDLVQDMQSKASNISQSLHGFAMFDDKDRKIGIWYSILSVKTTLRMKDERTVIIYTPDIDTYLKYEDGGHHRIK